MSKNTHHSYLEENISLFWNYMKEKYPVYKNSNIFFRDIQFGIKDFFSKRDQILDNAETEDLAYKTTGLLENKGVLSKLNDNTWKVNFLDDNIVINSNI